MDDSLRHSPSSDQPDSSTNPVPSPATNPNATPPEQIGSSALHPILARAASETRRAVAHAWESREGRFCRGVVTDACVILFFDLVFHLLPAALRLIDSWFPGDLNKGIDFVDLMVQFSHGMSFVMFIIASGVRLARFLRSED